MAAKDHIIQDLTWLEIKISKKTSKTEKTTKNRFAKKWY